MIEGVSLHNPVFVNTLGYACGLFVFGLLIVLLLRGRTRSGNRQRWESLIASSLAFLWNLGSLLGLALMHRNGQTADWLVALNFSILSLLPAILFSVVLKRRYTGLVRLGYLVAACSAILHFAELRFESASLHEDALLLVTAGFGVLLIVVAVRFPANADRRASVTDLVCLLLFTFSFLHFGSGRSLAPWTNEAWHHALIPVALVVLLRDYRLLLLETFIRFLANVSLAGVWAVCLYWANESWRLMERARGDGFATALLLTSFCCWLVLFALTRAWLQKWLTRSLFRRGDLNLCAKKVLQVSSESQTEKELLERAAKEIGAFVEADRFLMVEKSAGNSAANSSPVLSANHPAGCWSEVELPLRFSRGDSLSLLLGPRRGSRRYLAEDLASLANLSSLLIEQVERFRANELQRLAHQAELRALQAQINPHFLFNALNTLYGTIGRESFQARRLVLNLADLFRYCLQRDRSLIPLAEELNIVQAYLEIESLRLRDRLTFEITATDRVRQATIPVLSVQPLVENAIKHGISRLTKKGHVKVLVTESDGLLRVRVQDNGPGLDASSSTSGSGLGLENVRQRLRLCYGSSSGLTVESTVEGCSVTLYIPLKDPAARLSTRPRSQPETISN